jgi:hypothetical protein
MNDTIKHLLQVGEVFFKSYVQSQTIQQCFVVVCGAAVAITHIHHNINPQTDNNHKYSTNPVNSTIEPSPHSNLAPKPPTQVNPANVFDNTSRERDLLPLDRKYLFLEGDYVITSQHQSALKEIDPQLDILEKQDKTVNIQGFADAKGNNFSQEIKHQNCGNQRFEDIYYRPLDGNEYAKQLSLYKIGDRYNNFELSLLRARSYQCLLRATHPLLKTEILAGGVQPSIGSEFRKTRLSFSHNKLKDGDITPP